MPNRFILAGNAHRLGCSRLIQFPSRIRLHAVPKLCILASLFGAPSLTVGPVLQAGELPQKQEVLALLHKVNDWQLTHPIMPADDRNWERATWYTGVTAAWKTTNDRRFYDQALSWGRQHNWQVGTESDGANRLFCVETWLELYFVEHDRAMVDPAVRWLDTKAPNSPAGARVWYLEKGLRYVDSLYGAAALAMLSKATGDKKYLGIMNDFFNDVTQELFDPQSNLYYRDKRYSSRDNSQPLQSLQGYERYLKRRTASGRKVLWSRGNGWAFAGIARVLEYLPKEDPLRSEYLSIFKKMAAELAKRQGSDGLWRPNLDDPDDIPLPETSGSGFFCFGLAWGINEGVLDRNAYLPTVERAWAALAQNVSPEGKVLWGQQEDGQPNMLKQDSTHEYVTGTFLLAGSEVFRLVARRQ